MNIGLQQPFQIVTGNLVLAKTEELLKGWVGGFYKTIMVTEDQSVGMGVEELLVGGISKQLILGVAVDHDFYE